MSKIEKALSRAKRESGLALVPAATKNAHVTADAAAPGRELIRSGAEMAIASHAAAQSIARMRDLTARSSDELAEQHIISPDIGESSTVQAFRELRTRILQHTKGQNGIILVTSVKGDSGNSFVATNLGVAFAFDAGRTALLVDCNLRDPSLQRLLGDEDRPGITDYLENPDMDVADIIHPVGIERLRVMPTGRKRDIPTEYFTTQRARQLMERIRNRYAERFVIIDAPPMTESADTQILAELCDYILLVVPYGLVTNMQIDNCVKALDSRKFIGVVFNNDPHVPQLDWRLLLRQARTRLQDTLKRARGRFFR